MSKIFNDTYFVEGELKDYRNGTYIGSTCYMIHQRRKVSYRKELARLFKISHIYLANLSLTNALRADNDEIDEYRYLILEAIMMGEDNGEI
jgi:hypothetical protein